MTRHPAPWTAFALCVVATWLAACSNSPGGHAASPTTSPEARTASVAPVVVAARTVCRLIADNPDAAVAQLRGADGAPSIAVGGRAYWFFGDAVRNGPGGRQDVIPAAIATSADVDGRDCVRLAFKTANGAAEPMFPRLEETTAWPDGVLPLDDGSIAFYMVKVTRTSPFAWYVSGIGLGRMAAGTTDGTREVETIWDERSGFGARVSGARSPVRVGDDVIVFLHTDPGANYAARAPIARMGEAAAYTYWTGTAWSPRAQDAQPLWTAPATGFPADNGAQVSFDPASGQWMAVVAASMARVEVRTAPQPWGPWSAPTAWFDCRPLVEDVYPYCYSGELHPELSHDPATAYLTFSSQKPYDVTLVELHLGVAIREWLREDGAARYAAASPGDRYSDRGVAFYASAAPAPGLAAVYERDGAYTLAAAGGATAAFYAYAAATDGVVRTVPVYRWQKGSAEALDTRTRDGWQRGEIAFYAVCQAAEERGC